MENQSSDSSTPTINPSPFHEPPPLYYSFPPPTYQFPISSSSTIVDGNPRAASSMTWPTFLPRWAPPFFPRWPPSMESQSPSTPTSAMPMPPQLPFNWHHVNSSQLRPTVMSTTASTPHSNTNLGGARFTSLKDPMHNLHVKGKSNRHKRKHLMKDSIDITADKDDKSEHIEGQTSNLESERLVKDSIDITLDDDEGSKYMEGQPYSHECERLVEDIIDSTIEKDDGHKHMEGQPSNHESEHSVEDIIDITVAKDDGCKLVEVDEENQEVESTKEMDQDNLSVISESFIPKVGMSFNSIEDAFKFYKAYGYRTGFGIIKRTSHTFERIRYRCVFSCSKEGKPRFGPPNPRARRKPVTKTECKAMMVIVDRHLDNKWEVHVVELEHNHPLDPQMVRFMRCFRELPISVKKQLEINDKAGIRLNKSINAMFTEGGGFQNCSFIERDCRNHIAKARKLRLGEGDAEALLSYFESMQNQNTNFFYSWDMNEEDRLRNVFWADARSRAAYQYFGDVVTFDTTYLTNKYAMPFAPFVGVNHHGQSILLGCGLLADETMDSYVWLFTRWLICMHGKSPNAIITDQCKSISGAIAKVFPQAQHRFCLWHIMRKLPEKLGRMEEREAITSKLSKAVYDSLTVIDFEKDWMEMIEEFQLHDHEWFSSLYEDRRKWVPVYIKDTFWAGMSTTQRSESMNAFFDGYVNSKTSLKMFVEQYDNALRSKFEKEAQEDFRSFHSRPQLISAFPFEEQVARVYTMNIFYKFQDEVKKLLQCMCSTVNKNGPITTYTVTELEGDKRKDYRVIYNTAEKDVWCICRSFQFRGIVCRHALWALRQEFVTMLPSKYLLPRWRKDYKRKHASVSFPQITPMRETSRYDVLHMRGQHFFADIIELGATDDDMTEYALALLKEARERLINYEESRGDRRVEENESIATQICSNSAGKDQESEHDALERTQPFKIMDPIRAHPKGRPPVKRLVSLSEKAINKSRKRKSKVATKGNNSTLEYVQQSQLVGASPTITSGTQESNTPMAGLEMIDLSLQYSSPYF